MPKAQKKLVSSPSLDWALRKANEYLRNGEVRGACARQTHAVRAQGADAVQHRAWGVRGESVEGELAALRAKCDLRQRRADIDSCPSSFGTPRFGPIL